MRNIFKLCSAFFLLLTASSVNAQWIQTNGPFGCSVNCMLQHDSVILCGTLQGLYYSSDDGIIWQDYPLFQNKDVQSIYEKGDTLILLYSSGFVEQYYYDSVFSITSFNGGITWSPPVFFSQFGAVATSLHDANGKVIALDKYNGPSVSNDYGLTWTQIHIPFGYFVDLIYSGNYMILITINGAGTLNYFSYPGSIRFHFHRLILQTMPAFGNRSSIP